MRAAIITSSDSGYAGQREDVSGPVIQKILEQHGYEVVHQILLPDDREMLAKEMARIAEEESHLECSYDYYETPEDCIKEYETMFVCREREVVVAGAARSKNDGSPAIKAVSNSLFQEFLVEFSGFLRKFLLDREIGV